MMIELYVLNGDLDRIDVVDSYKSLIWANRYREVGDCELYVEATTKNINLFKKGNYLIRNDDEMVCRIKKVELDTDKEDGNFLIVTGYDVKDFLAQRVIWGQSNVDGNVETYIRNIIQKSLVNPNLSARQIRNASGRAMFYLGDPAGFTEVTTEQVSYKNVEEKVQELCEKYNWGYKVLLDESVKNLYFILYKGTNRSNTVVFAPEFENLDSTKYVDDNTNVANVALIAGEGEGSERSRNVSGFKESTDRYEIYVDARDISKTIKWSDLIALYPTTDQGGQGYITTEGSGTNLRYVYKMNYINIAIVDTNQLTELQAAYPTGQIVTISGNRYYQVYNAVIADIPSNTMSDNDDIILRDIVYSVYLLNRGYEKLAEYGTVKSFEGSVIGDITFLYKQDYFLGDIVTVRNEFGITAKARIIEVIEVNDENGYSIEPRFEYKNNTNTVEYLTTENMNYITTEVDEYILVEGGL